MILNNVSSRAFTLLLLTSSTMALQQVPALKSGSWISLDTNSKKRIKTCAGLLTLMDVTSSPTSGSFQIVHCQTTERDYYGKDPQDELIRDGDTVHILCNEEDAYTNGGRASMTMTPQEHQMFDNGRYLTVLPANYSMTKTGILPVLPTGPRFPDAEDFCWMNDASAWQTFQVCKVSKATYEHDDGIIRSDDQIALKPCISPRIFDLSNWNQRRDKCFKDVVAVDQHGNFLCSPPRAFNQFSDDQLLTVRVVRDGEMVDPVLVKVDYKTKELKFDTKSNIVQAGVLTMSNHAKAGEADTVNDYSLSVTHGKKVSHECDFELSAAVKEGIETEVEEKIPFIEAGKVKWSGEISSETKFSNKNGMEWDETVQTTYTAHVICPPQTKTVVLVTQQQTTIRVPMEATYSSGETVSLGDLVVNDGQAINEEKNEYPLLSDEHADVLDTELEFNITA